MSTRQHTSGPTTGPDRAVDDHGPIGRQLDIGAGSLGYEVHQPEAPVGGADDRAVVDVVFVHGWPLNRATWRPVARRLPRHRRHLLDLPGSGTSRTPSEIPVSFAGHIEAVLTAVDRLDLDRFALVGHDSGGLIARQVAAELPDRVTSLVLAGTEIPGHHPQLIGRLQRLLRLPGAARVMRAVLSRPRLARSDQLLGGLFHDRSLIEGDFRAEILQPMLDDPVLLARQIEILMAYQPELVDRLRAVHGRITAPTLLVSGRHDPFFPPDQAEAMLSQFAGPTRFELIDRARLLVHQEHPDRFAALTDDAVSQR